MALLWLVLSISLLAPLTRWIRRRKSTHPPGPRGLPIVGNLHQISEKCTHLQFQKWAEEYGPIYRLKFGTKTMIVLSGRDAVHDLLEIRGSDYSSRPNSHIINHAAQGTNMVMMSYNPTLQLCQRLVHETLRHGHSDILAYFEAESRKMLRGILDRPATFDEELRSYTLAVAEKVSYGSSEAVYERKHFESILDRWAHLTRHTFFALVDIFPLLQYLPDCVLPLRRAARQLSEDERDMFQACWQSLKHAGFPKGCFAHGINLEQQKERNGNTNGIPDILAASLCGVSVQALSATLATQLRAFVAAMMLFPQVQSKAYEEIHQKCGSRVPSVSDVRDMPYITATLKETCRWFPSPLLGIPHALDCDDQYMGYDLRKGSMVVLNVWALHMDPNTYQCPEEFDPERYLTPTGITGATTANGKGRDHYLFGAGRRLCPGAKVAEDSMVLSMARLLWAFSFECGRNRRGEEVKPDPDNVINGLPAHLAPFPAKIKPRSEQSADYIRYSLLVSTDSV